MRRGNSLLGLAAAVLGLLGLATACMPPSLLDETWGSSFRANKNDMIANPEAGKTPADPIEGLDPITGEAVLRSYQSGHTAAGQPAGPQTFIIGE